VTHRLLRLLPSSSAGDLHARESNQAKEMSNSIIDEVRAARAVLAEEHKFDREKILDWASSLSDLSRPAAEIGDSARISPRFRHLCSHKLLKLMKILTRTPIPSLRRSKSDRLLERNKPSSIRNPRTRCRWGRSGSPLMKSGRMPPHRRIDVSHQQFVIVSGGGSKREVERFIGKETDRLLNTSRRPIA
jgi:hypothetical protein